VKTRGAGAHARRWRAYEEKDFRPHGVTDVTDHITRFTNAQDIYLSRWRRVRAKPRTPIFAGTATTIWLP